MVQNKNKNEKKKVYHEKYKENVFDARHFLFISDLGSHIKYLDHNKASDFLPSSDFTYTRQCMLGTPHVDLWVSWYLHLHSFSSSQSL